MIARTLFGSSSLLLLASTVACTAILVPDEKDDGVKRCSTSTDCPEADDNRVEPACVRGEGQGDDSPKVCSVSQRRISCDAPPASDMDTPYGIAYNFARGAGKNAYVCEEEDLGQLGCGTDNDGNCAEGLELNDYSTCDKPEDERFAWETQALKPSYERAGKDVQDQFCRSFYCDDRFVCNNGFCEQCIEGAEPELGGCVTLHTQGERSSIYTVYRTGEPSDEELMVGGASGTATLTNMELGNCNSEFNRGEADADFGDPPEYVP